MNIWKDLVSYQKLLQMSHMDTALQMPQPPSLMQ